MFHFKFDMKFLDNQLLNKIFSFTNKSDKISLLVLTFITFIGLILELVGIAIIIPVISLAINPSNQYIELINVDIFQLSSSLGFKSPLIFLSTSLLLTFFIKMFFLTFVIYRQKKFVADLVKRISDKLYYNYLNQEYNYYSEKNKSSIIQNLQNETYHLFVFFESYITLVSEILLIISLLIVLLLLEPVGLSILLIFFTLSTVFYLFLVKNHATRWGNERLNIDQYLSKLILESIGNIKEILIYNTQEFFIKNFNSKNYDKSKFMSYRLTIDQFPKIYYEFMALIFILGYTYFLVINQDSTSTVITKLGLVIAVSYKIIPSLSRVSVNYQTIKNFSSSLIKIYDELTKSIVNKDSRKTISSFKNKIFFSKLFFQHKDSKKIFNNFNFEINKNETIGLVGRSGSGKSTLLDIISGLHKFQGDIFIDNMKLDLSDSLWKPKIGYVPQRTFLFQDTIKNNIIMSNIFSDTNQSSLNQSIHGSSLIEWISSLSNGLETNVGSEGSKISEGQKQRIGIARALYLNPEILIFDEPTSSLDIDTSKDIFKTIYSMKGKKTIIIVSHNPDDLMNCDRIIDLNK